ICSQSCCAKLAFHGQTGNGFEVHRERPSRRSSRCFSAANLSLLVRTKRYFPHTASMSSARVIRLARRFLVVTGIAQFYQINGHTHVPIFLPRLTFSDRTTLNPVASLAT